MKTCSRSLALLAGFASFVVGTLGTAPCGFCQPAPAQPATAQQPQHSVDVPRPAHPAPVEVSADRRITFRFVAGEAQSVRVNAGDIPGGGNLEMVKGANGVWEGTVGPVPPGAYRYHFNVDGMAVEAPRNPTTPDSMTTSESNDAIWSLVHVPGSPLMDTRDVPHGAIETVTYFSKPLDRFRRMHVYLPPGYENGTERYPIFYLLHGSGDSDDAWSTVGRAGLILDNLIADGKAKPMVVVMPAGHASIPVRRGATNGFRRDEFGEDFMQAIMPYAESHYRVYNDEAHRAIAGLSMGGGQTLTAAFATLDKFAYIGVFSSGASFGGRNGASAWEERHKDVLDNPELKKGIKLIWLSTGKDDRLIESTRTTVELLKKHGFEPVFIESAGAHTWLNWRDYLGEFAPQLFQ